MESETLHVTASQIEAAKLLIEMLEEDNEPVADDLRAIAGAEPASDDDVADAEIVEDDEPPRTPSARPHRATIASIFYLGPSGDPEVSFDAYRWRNLIAHRSVPTKGQLPLNSWIVLTSGLSPEAELPELAAELVAAIREEIPAEKLSDEARERLIILDTLAGPRVAGIVVKTPEAEAAHRWLVEHTARDSSEPSSR